MKKIIMSMCLIALVGFFVCSTASADQYLCGYAKVLRITLCPSDCVTDVPPPCKVVLDFTCTSCTKTERFPITVSPCGTEINLALLKAFNADEAFDVCVTGTPNPEAGSQWSYEMDCITFPKGASTLPDPVSTITGAAAIQ